MPSRSQVRRSSTIHERFDMLLRGNADIRDDLQSIYYEATHRTLNGMKPGEYANRQLEFFGLHPQRLAWKLGYDHGRFLLVLKQLGFEV